MNRLGATVTAADLIARLEAGREAEKELPAWNCPGCGDVINAPAVPVLLDGPSDRPRGRHEHLGVFEYLRDATCSGACHRTAAAREVPRVAVLRRAGVPAGWAAKVFRRSFANERAEYPAGETMTWREWSGDPPTVVIHGPNGTGKSMLAGELMVQCWRAGRIGVAWLTAPDLMFEHFDDDAKTRPLWRKAATAGVLVLDEYGRGKSATEYAAGIVCQLIERRLSRSWPTILPTNLEPDGKRPSIRSLDSALYDRLAGGLVFRMGGESLRRRR